MKILETPTDASAPEEFFEDLVLQLQNNRYEPYHVRLALMRLGLVKDFGLIIPRSYLSNITVPYTSEDIDYSDWTDEDAKKVYQHWDAVFVRKQPIQ